MDSYSRETVLLTGLAVALVVLILGAIFYNETPQIIQSTNTIQSGLTLRDLEAIKQIIENETIPIYEKVVLIQESLNITLDTGELITILNSQHLEVTDKLNMILMMANQSLVITTTIQNILENNLIPLDEKIELLSIIVDTNKNITEALKTLVENQYLNTTEKINYIISLESDQNTRLTMIETLLNNTYISLNDKLTLIEGLLTQTVSNIDALKTLVETQYLNTTEKLNIISLYLSNTTSKLQLLDEIKTLLESIISNHLIPLNEKADLTLLILNQTSEQIDGLKTLINTTYLTLDQKISILTDKAISIENGISEIMDKLEEIISNHLIPLEDKTLMIAFLVNATKEDIKGLATLINTSYIDISQKLDIIYYSVTNISSINLTEIAEIRSILENIIVNQLLTIDQKIDIITLLINQTSQKLESIETLLTTQHYNLTVKLDYLLSLILEVRDTTNLVKTILENDLSSIDEKASLIITLIGETRVDISVLKEIIENQYINTTDKLNIIISYIDGFQISIDTLKSIIENDHLTFNTKLDIITSITNETRQSINDLIQALSNTQPLNITDQLNLIYNIVNETNVLAQTIKTIIETQYLNISEKLTLINNIVYDTNLSLSQLRNIIETQFYDVNVKLDTIIANTEITQSVLTSINNTLNNLISVVSKEEHQLTIIDILNYIHQYTVNTYITSSLIHTVLSNNIQSLLTQIRDILRDQYNLMLQTTGGKQPTFSVVVLQSTVGANKVHLSIFNNNSTIRVIIHRIIINTELTAAVTGYTMGYRINRFTSYSGGTSVTIQQFDTNDVVPSNVIALTNPTISGSSTLIAVSVNPEETGGLHMVDLVLGQGNMKPIILNPGQGIAIQQYGTAGVGTVSVTIIFTYEKSVSFFPN